LKPGEGAGAYFSVIFSSIRRLRRLASGWKFAEPGRRQPLRRHAFRDEILHDRDGARGGKRPVRWKLRGLE
jgi:hypothetical protein